MGDLIILKKWAQAKLSTFVRDEKGEVNIVATVVLIGIAVILALVFKDAIKTLLDDLIGKITTTAGNAVTETY